MDLQNVPDVLAKIDLRMIEMHLFWVSGTFAEVWNVSMPPMAVPTCSTTPGSIWRARGGLSHLQDTSTQGRVDLDIAPVCRRSVIASFIASGDIAA